MNTTYLGFQIEILWSQECHCYLYNIYHDSLATPILDWNSWENTESALQDAKQKIDTSLKGLLVQCLRSDSGST